MNLEVYKDKRNKGTQFRKVPFGTEAMKAKKQAFKDITNEFKKNYVCIESKVLQSSLLDFVYIEINKVKNLI